jgi:type VI secretion system protein ImpF
MARVENDTGLLPSILDRLLDDAPNLQYEAIPNRFQDLRQVKEAVKRDIEALLNTRQETLDELPQSFTEVRRSLLVYGLPDCTALSLHNPQDHRRIRQALEYTIATFERRLERVRVTVEPHNRTIMPCAFASMPCCASNRHPSPSPLTLCCN